MDKISKKWVVISVFLIAFVAFVILVVSTNSPSPSILNSPQELRTVGQEGFLRLPNNPDPSKAILVAPTAEIAEEVVKMYIVNDVSIGALRELTEKGVFDVSNGAKVRVIDKTFTLTKIRILQGICLIDQNCIGRSGWIPKEFIVDH